MQLTGLDLIFWVVGLLAHLTLLAVLVIRRRYGRLPVFTAFIASNIARTIVLFFTLHFGSSYDYFITYWALAIIDVALQLAVIYEVASQVFRPLGEWAHDVRRPVIFLVAGSCAIASFLTWLAAPETRTFQQAVVIRGNFFSSALMSELFVGMIWLSTTAGLPWKTHVARVSQGLGIYSIAGILTEGAHAWFGVGRDTRIYAAVSHLRITAYLSCLGYWILTLWSSAPEPRVLPSAMGKQLSNLDRWIASDLNRIRSPRNS